MSRVGKNPVAVPGGVDVTIAAGLLTAKGKLGEQEVVITDDVTVERDGDEILVKPRNDSKRSRAMWGTVRRSEEHTSELQSLMRISYAVFCLKKKKTTNTTL